MARKKYITADLYNKFKKLFPEITKKTTPEVLWNLVADKTGIEASIEVESVRSQIKFEYKGETHRIVRPTEEIFKVVNGDTKEENYELLIKDALYYLLDNKLIKPARKKKEKN